MIPFIIGVLVATIIFLCGWLIVINRQEKGLPTISVSISGTKEKIKNWGKKVKKDFSDLINGIKTSVKHFFDFKGYSGREKTLGSVILALLSAIAVFAILSANTSYYKNKLDDLIKNYNLLAEKYTELREDYSELSNRDTQREVRLVEKENKYKELQDKYENKEGELYRKNKKISELYEEIRRRDAALKAQGLYYDDGSRSISIIPEEEIIEEEADTDNNNAGGWEDDYDYKDDYDYEEDYDDDDYGTVYWTSGGKVYHSTKDCPSLGRSSNIRSGSISESGKSRACKNCY